MKFIQILLVFICSFFFLYLLRDLNSSELKEILFSVNFFPILLAVFFCACGVIGKVYRLKIIAEQFGLKVNLSLAYKSQTVSLLLAMLTPARFGEISKLWLLAENDRSKYPLVANITLYEICIDFICISLISLIFVLLALKNFFLAGIIVLLLIFSGIVAFFLTKANKYKNLLPGKLQSFFVYLGENKIDFGYKFYLTFPLSFSAWFIDGIFQYYLLKAIGIESDILFLVAVSAFISVLSVVSILPLGLGVTDLSALFFYEKFIGLQNQQILYILNFSRILLVLTLILMCLPFLKIIFLKRKEMLGKI